MGLWKYGPGTEFSLIFCARDRHAASRLSACYFILFHVEVWHHVNEFGYYYNCHIKITYLRFCSEVFWTLASQLTKPSRTLFWFHCVHEPKWLVDYDNRPIAGMELCYTMKLSTYMYVPGTCIYSFSHKNNKGCEILHCLSVWNNILTNSVALYHNLF